MKSTQPAAMALCGMPSNLADFSSWAKVIPSSALIAANPKVPSEAVPERITPIALLRWSSASERRNDQLACDGYASLHGLLAAVFPLK